MSRRNSSLVTVALGILPMDEEIPPPYTTTTVIEIGDDDEINTDARFSSSTERIFQIVVEDDSPQDVLTFEQTKRKSSEPCSELRSWFRSFQQGRDQISGCINAKLAALHEKLQSRCEKSYLETYFLYANVCGVSPFRFGKENKPVIWLKKVPYYIVNTLAAFDTVRITKQLILNMIGAHKDGSPEIRLYLFNCLRGANILLRVGFFVSLKFHAEKYFNAVETVSLSFSRKHLYNVKRLLVSMLICGSSYCVVLITTHVRLLNGYENYLNKNVEYAMSNFYIWRSLPQVDLAELSSTSKFALGMLGWATKFAGTLLGQIARDGVLFSALTLGKSANAFRFKDRARVADPENANFHDIGAEIHTEYQDLKKISKFINSAFNVVFRFFLLANIFMFAVFIDEYFDPDLDKIAKVVKSVNVLFVCITFYYANQAAKTGDRFREWMKKRKNRDIVGMSQMDVMEEALSSTAVGYGRGALFIYDSTLIGFASVVAAYFLGIVETRQQPNLQSEVEDLCPGLNTSTLH